MPPAWRRPHLGDWLALASARFDARVLALLADHTQAPLALAHRAARDQLSAAHLHLPRHLPPEGARPSALAARMGLSKQAVGKLVDEWVRWGLVARAPDPHDARACRVAYTAAGLAWLGAWQDAVAQAHDELQAAVGADVATVIALGLEAYAA